MKTDPKIFFVIFLCSFSSLAYEIALIRIFSISLWYHFAFMVISIAMLGIGASGTVLSIHQKFRNISNIRLYSLFLGVGISMSYLISNQIPFDPMKLSWDKIQLLYIGLYYIILSIPFFFTGLIIATAFSCMSEKTGLVYGSDLLGAGIGSLGILYLMTIMTPDRAVFILSSIALTGSFVISRKRLKVISLSFILVNLSIFLFQPSFTNIRMSPYKGLQLALRYPGAKHLRTYFNPFSRIDTFISPAVRFAPGLSLKYLDPLPDQVGFSIDGSEINAITSVRGGVARREMESPGKTFLTFLPSALPYEIRNPSLPPFHSHLTKGGHRGVQSKEGEVGLQKGRTGGLEDVLILDPKGGLHVLVASYYGSKNIYKVESNLLVIKVINDEFKDFSGNFYSNNAWSGIGRSWLKTANKKFDIIDISLMGSSPSGSFGISEDYRFTVDAFREYINNLKPDGLLNINLFILPPPRIELRLMNTIITAMEEIGIKDTEHRIAAIRSWGTITIIIKKSPFSLNEIETIREFSKNRRFDLIHYPGIKEEEANIYIRTASNEYFTVFKEILNPETRSHFIHNYIFDISPVHDENPFFHYYLKIKNIRKIYMTMGGKWQYFIEEGYILPVVFIQVIILSLILIVLPAFSKEVGVIARRSIRPPKQPNPQCHSERSEESHGDCLSRCDLAMTDEEATVIRNKQCKMFLPYFAFLGIGFMFIEISLIQKIILPLEHSSYAVATVLTSILISSGIGSLLSQRFPGLKSPSTVILISFLIIIYSILLPSLTDTISPYSISVRIISVFLILTPLGLLMGIPFPTGLKILGEKNESLIPWAWAINGCFSVLAPILTIMLAMVIGFKMVLWLGALSYGMAFITLKTSLKKLT
jgi:hypothetical protein